MNLRSLRHAVTCASGARAETRGPCDCDAAHQPPAWTVRILDGLDVAITVAETLTPSEAVWLSFALQDCTRECGRRQALADARRRNAP